MIDLPRLFPKRNFALSSEHANQNVATIGIRVTLLGEDSLCMVNLLEMPELIAFFSYYMIGLLRLFQKRCFVLSSKHEN